jgi:hypothetical protein
MHAFNILLRFPKIGGLRASPLTRHKRGSAQAFFGPFGGRRRGFPYGAAVFQPRPPNVVPKARRDPFYCRFAQNFKKGIPAVASMLSEIAPL